MTVLVKNLSSLRIHHEQIHQHTHSGTVCIQFQGLLRQVIGDLVANQGVTMFYVGNQGRFDALVRSVLRELGVRYAVVLAYMPTEDINDTMLPEGIETVHPRYAISWRNCWMVQQAELVVCYVRHTWGGTYRYMEYARRRKTVFNITNQV